MRAQIDISKPKSLFLFAGEQSGDVLGGKLIEALKKSHPETYISGVGGYKMQAAGMDLFLDMKAFHVMGFSQVLGALPRLYKEFRKIKAHILSQNPTAVIFIDYPDFNMRMAKALRKQGFSGKLIHYVCPSVWAWRKNRIFGLAKTLDLLLSILPFEKTYFNKTNLRVSYVGHPLVSAIENHVYDPKWKEKNHIISKKPILAVFPGSRSHEIKSNLSLQLKSLEAFENDYVLAISSARAELEPLIRPLLKKGMLIVPQEHRYELMRDAAGALATSGTVILELGLHGTPTISTYQMNFFNAHLARYVLGIKLPFYTLVNIVCQKEVFPEFIHWRISPSEISQALKNLLSNREKCKKECLKLRELLQIHDASLVAAHTIFEITS